MGFKLVYDAAIYLLSDLEDVEEVAAVLEELDNDWHIGAIEDPEWNQKMLAGTPKLFTVGTDSGSVVDQGEGGGSGSETFTARILQVRGVETLLGKLNPEAVQGLWASMGHELLYLTNDDDERYSIQANPPLLRNLTMQAAPTPLGYPAFEACHISVDSRGVVRQSANVSLVEQLDAPATAVEASASTDTATASAAASAADSDLPYGGDMQAAMRAHDRDAIRQIMATRSERSTVPAAAPSQTSKRSSSPARSPTIHRPGGLSSGVDAGLDETDDLGELEMMLGDVEAPATSAPPSSVVSPPARGGGGASWMESVLNEVENESVIQTDASMSNPFIVPSTPTNAESTRSAKPVKLPSSSAGDSDDELMAQLAASEDRLNAARAGAAASSETATTSMQRVLGPQSDQVASGSGNGANDDTNLDELDDLLEEFL